MRIGFTGCRDGMTEQQKQTLIEVLQEYRPAEFHHGDCIGADAEARWPPAPEAVVIGLAHLYYIWR